MMKLISERTYEEKKSRFIARMYSLENEEDNKLVLQTLRNGNPDAKHLLHVSRFENRFKAYTMEASDDREPISSMKKASRYFERDDIRGMGIFIIRYYGGKELGASHLDQVYFKLTMKLFEEYKSMK
jgi:putative IMPACT (imprinted ancient) family translation regulator